jgi:hypothetical protein
VNERDDLGDDIPSDYFTHVIDGGFYGFPFSYIGNHVDSRVAPRPDLVAKALVPDMLLGGPRGAAAVCVLRRGTVSHHLLAWCLYRGARLVDAASGAGIKSSLFHSAMASPPESQHLSSPDLCLIPLARMSMAAAWAWWWNRKARC